MMPAMDTAVALDPVLRSFRDAVVELYGPMLDRLVLFGSRARGDARPDSDYDVLDPSVNPNPAVAAPGPKPAPARKPQAAAPGAAPAAAPK